MSHPKESIILGRLLQRQDPTYRDFHKKLLPTVDPERLIGVRTPQLRSLAKELSDTMFRNDDAIRKCAMFVKSYMDLGGHQMQINAVNRDRLLDAQKHPENYRNLIVRVWGWSGYFVELNEVYQNHIIKRTEMIL